MRYFSNALAKSIGKFHVHLQAFHHPPSHKSPQSILADMSSTSNLCSKSVVPKSLPMQGRCVRRFSRQGEFLVPRMAACHYLSSVMFSVLLALCDGVEWGRIGITSFAFYCNRRSQPGLPVCGRENL